MIPNAHEAVKTYQQRGWREVLPLPAGKKLRPPTGLTGNIPASTDDALSTAWGLADEDANLAIRLPENVIALDIDQHDDNKDGARTFAQLEEDLGPLPTAPYSSRHGATSPTKHLFYRVPAGIKWKAKAGAGVDVRQHSHSYCVAWPSTYEGTCYRWYNADGTELDTPPVVDDLPELPTAWIEHLTKGALDDYRKTAPNEDFEDGDATAWVRSVAPDYDAPMSSAFAAGVRARAEAFDLDAHDTMLSAQAWALAFAVLDGQPGLGPALNALQELFSKARGLRPRGEAPSFEWSNALTGAVNDLRGRIEHGKAKPFISQHLGVAPVDLSTLGVASSAEEDFQQLTHDAVKALTTLSTGDALAEITARLSPDFISSEGVILDIHTLEEVSKARLNSQIKKRVRPLLVYLYGLFDSESDDEKEAYTSRQIGNALRLADDGAKRGVQLIQLESALMDNGREVPSSKFNSTPDIVGLPDRRCIDLRLCLERYRETGKVEIVTRALEATEIVTHVLNIDVEKARCDYLRRKSLLRGNEVAGERFMSVFAPDPRDQQQLWDVFSEIISSNTEQAVMPWLFGSGGSGKSTFLDMTMNAFNASLYGNVEKDVFGQVDSEKLSSRNSANSHNQALFSQGGKFAVRISETGKETPVSGAVLKQALSGGIRAKENGTKREITFRSTLVGESNEAPSLTVDSGIKRRIFAFQCNSPLQDVGKVLASLPREWKTDDDQRYWVLLQLVGGWVRRASGEVNILDRSNDAPMLAKGTKAFFADADPIWEFVDRHFMYSEDSKDTLSVYEIERKAREVGLIKSGEELDKATLSALKRHLTALGCTHHTKVPKHGKDADDRRTNRGVGYRNVVWIPGLALVDLFESA